MKNRKVNIKRKNNNPDKVLSIYMFNTFDDFCEFCTYLSNSHLSNLTKKLKSSKLCLYNSNYYLVLHNIILNIKEFKAFHSLITEFRRICARW